MSGGSDAFSLKLVNRASRKTMHMAMQNPVRVLLPPEVAGKLALWKCQCTVRRRRRTVFSNVYGGSWLDALMRAGEGLRRMIPAGETRDWVTEQGVESKDRKVWVPSGPGSSAHGGPHWDVQDPKTGGRGNVWPPK